MLQYRRLEKMYLPRDPASGGVYRFCEVVWLMVLMVSYISAAELATPTPANPACVS